MNQSTPVDVLSLILDKFVKMEGLELDDKPKILAKNYDTTLTRRDFLSDLKLPILLPLRTHLFPIFNKDTETGRKYCANPGLLLAPVAEIIGEVNEISFANMVTNEFKWVGYERIRRPKGVLLPIGGRPAWWYLIHIRRISLDQPNLYHRNIAALDRNSWPIPLQYEVVKKLALQDTRRIAKESIDVGASVILSAAFIDDSYRVNTFRVHLKDVNSPVTLKLTVPEWEVQTLLKLREGPLTPAGRRKAILHWVCSHLRRLPQDKGFTVVSEYIRGITKCEFGGFAITIYSNKHDSRLKHITDLDEAVFPMKGQQVQIAK